MKKILMILTSHASLADKKNGTRLWLSSFADAYQVFADEGFEVTVASPVVDSPRWIH
ncbi:hypothetical protein H8S90_13915 [Olivibacter sp. SDN3]|uniref:hypothetical protein n=1 Tax=Olivibacter sp. SDN3 TaxID=2764720 RepID=UPI0016518FA8|nr:hypothetical protein [Olivibacter sp. SDN3]QNL47915.1 hypothetical protein H8S90_13915 [Olivibacter sp. SDN3]